MGQNSNKERLEQRNRELSILNTIANALNSSVKLNDALQAALEHVAGLLALHTGWVWLLREESEASYLAAALNLPRFSPQTAPHGRLLLLPGHLPH